MKAQRNQKMSNTEECKTKVSIDFFMETVKIFIIAPVKEVKEDKNEENQENELVNIPKIKKNHKILEKNFKISDDYEKITIEDVTYDIPTYFNRETMKAEDEKTWQMIFYQIFYDFINKELQKFKTVSSIDLDDISITN